MALNHEVHIPEVMSIIFLLAFYSQPTIKDTLLGSLCSGTSLFCSDGKGEGKGHVNISTSIYPSSNVTNCSLYLFCGHKVGYWHVTQSLTPPRSPQGSNLFKPPVEILQKHVFINKKQLEHILKTK